MTGNSDQQETPRKNSGQKESGTKASQTNKSEKEPVNSHLTASLWNRLKNLTARKRGDVKEADISWWKTFGISIACYAPAFFVVIISFWLFKHANTFSQNTNQANQPLTERQKNQIAEEVNRIIDNQKEEFNKKLSQQEAFSKQGYFILKRDISVPKPKPDSLCACAMLSKPLSR